MKTKEVKKAIIPAAGFGTRFLPYTKSCPKEMLPIVDKPVLQYIVEEAIASGIEEILIITGRNKRTIEDHFDKSIELELELEQKGKIKLLEEVQGISNMVNIHYVRQKEMKGLGHAIYCAKSFVGDEPFAVMLGDDVVFNPDTPCLSQLIDAYNEYHTSILGVQVVNEDDLSKYGIVEVKHIDDNIFKVKGIIEKPPINEAPSKLAVLGRYIITPEIFSILEHQLPGKGGEIQLTDALDTLMNSEAIYACEFEGRRYDLGDKLGFLEATIEYALRRPELVEDFIDFLSKINFNSYTTKKKVN